MEKLRSKYRTMLDNLNVDMEKVSTIKLGKPNPANPRVWMLYFMETCDSGREKLVRSWYYDSEAKRADELKTVLKKYPSLSLT